MKKFLIPILLILSAAVQAQTTGTIQKTTATGVIRYSGSNGVDTLVKKKPFLDSLAAHNVRINGKADQSTTISAGNGLTGGGSLAANRTLSADTSILRTVANSVSLTGLQTRLNAYALLSGANFTGAIAGTTASFSGNVTAKGDLLIWGGNGAQTGFITANSAGGGLYIGASGTDQNIRLVPSGTGILLTQANMSTRDITVTRGNTTGMIYLGDNSETRYLYYNGTYYELANAELNVNGYRVLNAGNVSTYAATPSYADAKVAQTITNGVTTSAPSQDAVYDALALKADKPVSQALTDGSTITWDISSGGIATVTLGGNRTLAITNPVANSYYQLTITQDGTGSRTITLPAGSKVIGGGAGSVTLTTTAGAKDILSFFYDGTNYYVNIGLNYN